ncbi:MAG: hypothetical protein KAS72_07010 [Phycisphaerales bacterium]|nr:hypothetical protein [Phycisphaerales bacterium]
MGVVGVVALLVLTTVGCAPSPRDHWVKVHRHRIEPLTDAQIAALDTWSDESTMGIAVAIAGENWSMFAAVGE